MDKTIEKKIKETFVIPKIVYYFLLGILWATCQSTYSFAILTWFALVPYLFTIKYEETKYGFLYSLIFGTSSYLWNLWWLPFSIINFFSTVYFDKKSLFFIYFISGIIYLIISIYHGLIFSFIFSISKIISKKSYYLFYLIFPIVTTLFDYFYPKLFHDQIGYSQFVFFHFIQIVDLFGVPFITLLVLYSNVATIFFIESIMYKKQIKRAVTLVIFISILIVSTVVYGFLRYDGIIKLIENAPVAKIGVIQGNYPVLDKLNSNNHLTIIAKYNALSNLLVSYNPDLLIWPEAAIPFIVELKEINCDLIKNFKLPLLTGIHIKEEDSKKYYNSMILISKNNRILDYYSKIKLFPFTERFLPSKLLKSQLLINFSKGENQKILKVEKLKIAPCISNELLFSNFIRKSININGEDANLLVNITNDSWFGKNFMPEAHLNVAIFRAIENRKSLIRVASTGYTAYLNPAGDIIYISSLFEESSSVINVPLLEEGTFYQKSGWMFIWVLLVIFIIIALIFTITNNFLKLKKRYEIEKSIHTYNLKKTWFD